MDSLSPRPALVDAQVVLDHHTLPALQERFADFVNDDSSVEDFSALARDFLEWPDDCLFTLGHPDRPLPPELVIPLPELGESLAPAIAFRDPRAKDPAQPWLLLVGLLPADTDLDALPTADSRVQWVASASRRFERLLRETHVPVGLLSNGTHFRLFSAPRGGKHGARHLSRCCHARSGRAANPGRFSSPAGSLPAPRRSDRGASARSAATLPAVPRSGFRDARGTGARRSVRIITRVRSGGYAYTGGALLKEVVARRPNDVYDGLLTVLLRLVFLLFAEDRGPAAAVESFQRQLLSAWTF